MRCAVKPGQVIEWSHAEAGDDCSLPLLGEQLLPHALLGSQWLLHLVGGEEGVERVLKLNKPAPWACSNTDLLQVEDGSRDPLDSIHHPVRVWRALTPYRYVLVQVELPPHCRVLRLRERHKEGRE